MSKKRRGILLPAISVSILAAGGIAIAAGAFYKDMSYLRSSNIQMAGELSLVRVERYVADGDIAAGDEIIYEGEGRNVLLSQVYSSFPEEYFIKGEAGYAQNDIPNGSPIMKSQVAETEPLLTLEPEQVVKEVPESFDIPYSITIKHLDGNGTELHKDTAAELKDGVGEQSLWEFQETIEGYFLDRVWIGNTKVFSIGVARVQDGGTMGMYYYYTGEDATKRYEITGDIEVRLIYEKGEAPEYTTTSAFAGIPETEPAEEGVADRDNGDPSDETDRADEAVGAIVFDDIENVENTDREDIGNGKETPVQDIR